MAIRFASIAALIRSCRQRVSSQALSKSLNLLVLAGAVSLGYSGRSSVAQAPISLPYTMTTLAGTSPMSSTAGTQCPNLPTGVVSANAFGDNCLAANAIFGAAARGGVQVDSFGNVFVADDVNGIIHVINPTTGIISVLAGGASAVCAASTGAGVAGAVDTMGDGCLAATQTKTAGQRGIGIDSYGNVLLGGYSDNAIHLICRTASPNCTSAQIGTMQLVAGCVKNATSGATAGVGVDNVKAAQTFVTAGCTTSNGEVDNPRGATGDVYGNVYFADTATSRTRVVVGPLTSPFFTGNNPLYAALGVYYASVSQGFVYTVVNTAGTSTSTGGLATTKGNACSVTTNSVAYSGTALDTWGDGCPLEFSSVVASSGYTSGVAADASGNMVFTDPTHGLRVFYVNGSGTAGGLMQNAIIANNPGVTPQAGFTYALWGGGTTALRTDANPWHRHSGQRLDDHQGHRQSAGQHLHRRCEQGVELRHRYRLHPRAIRGVGGGGRNRRELLHRHVGSEITQRLQRRMRCEPVSLFEQYNGLGVAVDGQNNLYLFDASSTTKMLVRKVLAQGFAAQTVGSTQIQNFQVHVSETAAGSVASPVATLTTNPDMSVGSVACGAQNADNSFDCNVSVTTTPSAAGLRSATLTESVPFSGGGTSTINLNLGGVATGSVMAFDSASSTTGSTTTPIAAASSLVFSTITPDGVALYGSNNVYTMDTHGSQFLENVADVPYVSGTGGVAIAGTLPLGATQLAIDQLGDIFAVGAGASTITELAVSGAPASVGAPSTYTSTSISYTPVSGTAAPTAIATDVAGNLFVADKQSSSANTGIYRLSLVQGTAQPQVTVGTGFTNPVALAVDPAGNVYVADKGAGAVYKLTPGLISGVPGYVQTTVSSLSGVVPVGVATDPAGDLYVADATSLSIIEVPVSGPNTTIYTGLTSPNGLAVDGRGDVFVSDAGLGGVYEIGRDAFQFNFGTGSATAPTLAGTLTNVGNQAATGSNTVTNTTNFAVVGGTSNGCNFTSSVLGAQAAGNACTLSATFVGNGSSTVTDLLSYLPAASTVGTVTMTGTLQGTAIGTTTTISAPNPANPSYSATGTEVTFTVTVAAQSGAAAPGGTVAVTVDSTTTNPSLVASGTSGIATVTLSGLTAGSHTISAIYSTSGSFTGSNSGSTPVSFSIAQSPTITSWTPATTTVQYSSPIGTSALNATASFNSSAVPGVFVYTANGVEVNAATYLAIGTYTLGVTFYPSDSVDFSTSTASGGTFSVTQASTTAPVGATQNLVAADGTGNYTSVQSAINALPTTGGSVYLKPGTYTGFVTVVKPSVSMYGLGGNPNNIVITNEDGAFSSPFPAGAGPGNNGSSGDQGSSTLVVARGTVGGFTGTPSNFYADNFTVANTYDTDNINTTTNATVGGVCTAGQPAQTFMALYNSGTLCNSQALAVWITGDQAVMNNIYSTSQQDTIYAGSISAGSAYAARQYWFRGKVTGDVDYIFGDAAAVFDHTTIYTTWHGNTATGTETIEAQNQADQTGATPSYLSGYIMNSNVFTSQSTGMNSLYFGRPYGHYSTYIMLNSYIDQVAPAGYIEFSGDTNLPTSTYAEYNNIPYTDPATGSPDANGVTYLGTGGNTGTGVTGTRETTSQDPGTPEAANTIKTSLTQPQAQQYYPIAFLSQTVPTSPYNTVTNWNPTAAIATGANAFVPSGSGLTVNVGSSVTILIRPQTPGLGAVTNGSYTIPTGTYTLTDTFNSTPTVLASGSLDASGEAYFISSSLAIGTHNLTWTYSGDSNFAGSTTASAYSLVVSPIGTTTTLAAAINPITYGQSVSITATVSPVSGTTNPSGSVTLTIDGTTTQTAMLSNGVATFTVTGLQAGTHSFSASYAGGGNFGSSSTASSLSLGVNAATLTVTGACANRIFDQPSVCSASVLGYQYSDGASTIFAGTPTGTTTALRTSPAGPYTASPLTSSLTLTNFGSNNYAVSTATSSFTVSGGAPQSIIFAPLPAFAHGATYQLSARTTSGLPVTYTVTAGGSVASVSGSTLTVTGTGTTVTIQASTAADPTGDYTLATPVSMSFTPQ